MPKGATAGNAPGTGGSNAFRTSLSGGLIRAARPKQWSKNLLLLAAPGAAGVLGEEIGTVSLAFLAFCLAASGTYFLNDVADREADRRHPAKSQRAIASGVVSVPLAIAVGVGALVASLAIAAAVRPAFLVTVALYIGFTSSYSLWLRDQPVVDLGLVAAGFVIRAVAGGVAVDVPISRWFLIVTSFASLFMVVGRRHAEQALSAADSRSTLTAYSGSYLQSIWTMAGAITITAYCLWAFEQSEGIAFPWYELTIVPFVLAMLRYALVLDAGKAGQPEDVFLNDRSLQVMSAVWVVLFGLAVYVGE